MLDGENSLFTFSCLLCEYVSLMLNICQLYFSSGTEFSLDASIPNFTRTQFISGISPKSVPSLSSIWYWLGDRMDKEKGEGGASSFCISISSIVILLFSGFSVTFIYKILTH